MATAAAESPGRGQAAQGARPAGGAGWTIPAGVRGRDLRHLDHPVGQGPTCAPSRTARRGQARDERARAGTSSSCSPGRQSERPLHGIAVPDRAARRASARTVTAVLPHSLREGRQEGRAARVDSRPRRRRALEAAGARRVADAGHPRRPLRGSSACRWIINGLRPGRRAGAPVPAPEQRARCSWPRRRPGGAGPRTPVPAASSTPAWRSATRFGRQREEGSEVRRAGRRADGTPCSRRHRLHRRDPLQYGQALMGRAPVGAGAGVPRPADRDARPRSAVRASPAWPRCS